MSQPAIHSRQRTGVAIITVCIIIFVFVFVVAVLLSTRRLTLSNIVRQQLLQLFVVVLGHRPIHRNRALCQQLDQPSWPVRKGIVQDPPSKRRPFISLMAVAASPTDANSIKPKPKHHTLIMNEPLGSREGCLLASH